MAADDDDEEELDEEQEVKPARDSDQLFLRRRKIALHVRRL